MRGSFRFRKNINLFAQSVLMLLLLGFGTSAAAENSRVFGDYVVHYNAFRSDTLSPEMAKAYELTRRNNRIIVNITVLKKVLNTTGKPVASTIAGNASNLTGQLKNLEFHQIKEGTAIYYLAESQFTEGEFLKFELQVTPEGQTQAATISFDKKFSTK